MIGKGAVALLGALFFGAGLLGCAKMQVQDPKAEAAPKFVDLPPSAERDKILVLTPFLPSAHTMWASMRDEIADELDVVTVEMAPDVTPASLKAEIDAVDPQCVVLIGNHAARVFRSLQNEGVSTPPAVVLMSSFAKQVVGTMKGSTGIAYEVPAVTSFVTLRQLSERPLRRVGVVYRPALTEFVKEQVSLARMEKVELIGVPVEGTPGARKIRLSLRELILREKVDAIWVLNDNALLNPSAIRDGWLPEVRRSGVPVLVGVSSLVNSQLSFGSVAIVPDHTALGVQAANLLFELADEDWEVADRPVELPLSVETVVDMSQKDLLHLSAESSQLIDRAVL